MRFHIEKNTVELRQKLENMGFEKNPFMSPEEYIDENMFWKIISKVSLISKKDGLGFYCLEFIAL